MKTTLQDLEPQLLWQYFQVISAVPRASNKEAQVTKFIQDFGTQLGLETELDKASNLIIRKPASPGMENCQTVALQSHLDMVHQKNAGTNFDFDTQGIEMYVENNWVKANGTTLGADNGIGVAAIMAILASKELPHPPLEALFTVNEENGMSGAKGLEPGKLQASILLNLDSEDINTLTIGSAGRVAIYITGKYNPEQIPSSGFKTYQLKLENLTGGHSGLDIHLGRGNAIILLNQFLSEATKQFGVRMASITGGGLLNAIPRAASAVVFIPTNETEAFRHFVHQQASTWAITFKATDPNLTFTVTPCNKESKVLPADIQQKLLQSINIILNGVYSVTPEMETLVQTSNNLASIKVEGSVYEVNYFARSSHDQEKMELANSIRQTFEAAGAEVILDGPNPGWAPSPDSAILSLMQSVYRQVFHKPAQVVAIHAGLECGIIGAKYPGMEMVSFGPTILNAHSPDEKVAISTVEMFWKLLCKTLEQIPLKTL
ncbi:aminoacyl-histidine dipeptidase [Pontibacter vulgaris]|uniref:aminoacyl-histidine dipeptidase n=1 Tax=Pontibacter vulgaris TaxID=2905679 RepID=UPI001FA7440B|nr:aminoacyl-histidine dipeptidase [Pontibacter vulgaris]